MTLNKIDINSKISAKDHLLLHAFHAFINNKDVNELRGFLLDLSQNEKVYFYQNFIQQYNNMINTEVEGTFLNYIKAGFTREEAKIYIYITSNKMFINMRNLLFGMTGINQNIILKS